MTPTRDGDGRRIALVERCSLPESPRGVRTAEPTTVPALLAARAAAEPGRVALRLADGDGLTYQDWDRRSDAVAADVRERGLRPGEPVGLVFAPGGWLDFAVAYCGVQKAGGVAVPLGAHLGARTIADLLRQCGVAGTVHDGSAPERSEERRVGKECMPVCRSRWSPYH